MREFLLGVSMMGFSVAALFFARFWRRTRDRLFAGFAAAFAMLAIVQLAIVLTNEHTEARTGVYGLRLAAFLTLLWAIVDKNRNRT
jgi:drug/metabolite transporter (DMT)-like permease